MQANARRTTSKSTSSQVFGRPKSGHKPWPVLMALARFRSTIILLHVVWIISPGLGLRPISFMSGPIGSEIVVRRSRATLHLNSEMNFILGDLRSHGQFPDLPRIPDRARLDHLAKSRPGPGSELEAQTAHKTPRRLSGLKRPSFVM